MSFFNNRKKILFIACLLIIDIICGLFVLSYKNRHETVAEPYTQYLWSIDPQYITSDFEFDSLALHNDSELVQNFSSDCISIEGLYFFAKHSYELTDDSAYLDIWFEDGKGGKYGETTYYFDSYSAVDEWTPCYVTELGIDFSILSQNETATYSMHILPHSTDDGDWNLALAPLQNYKKQWFAPITSAEDNLQLSTSYDSVLFVNIMLSCTPSKSFDSVSSKELYAFFSFALCTLMLASLCIILASFIPRKKLLTAADTVIVIVLVLALCFKYYSVTNNWYDYGLVMHGGGEVDSIGRTNSLEAINNSISSDCRLIEVDLTLTSDNQLVLRHDWATNSDIGLDDNYIPSKSEFNSLLINEKYHTVDYDKLLDIIKANPKLYIITDTKNTDADTINKTLSQMRDIAIARNDKKLLDRFIVQIYSDEMFYIVKNIYDFDTLYTIYQRGSSQPEQLIDFCKTNDIDVITVPMGGWDTNEALRECLRDSGLIIYLHTVNDLKELNRYQNEGVHSVYTDFLK